MSAIVSKSEQISALKTNSNDIYDATAETLTTISIILNSLETRAKRDFQ